MDVHGALHHAPTTSHTVGQHIRELALFPVILDEVSLEVMFTSTTEGDHLLAPDQVIDPAIGRTGPDLGTARDLVRLE